MRKEYTSTCHLFSVYGNIKVSYLSVREDGRNGDSNKCFTRNQCDYYDCFYRSPIWNERGTIRRNLRGRRTTIRKTESTRNGLIFTPRHSDYSCTIFPASIY